MARLLPHTLAGGIANMQGEGSPSATKVVQR